MISRRDSKPFQIKFPVGVLETTKSNMIYEDNWRTVYGIINGYGNVQNRIYGTEQLFDRVIIVNAGSLTRYINSQTIFMVDNMPTDTFPTGDYSVKYISPEYNGEIKLGLDKKEAVDIPKLYFYQNNDLLYFQVNYDKKQKIAYINSKDIIPISIGTFVWDRKPSGPDSTNHRLRLTEKVKIGFDNTYKNFYKLTFIEA